MNRSHNSKDGQYNYQKKNDKKAPYTYKTLHIKLKKIEQHRSHKKPFI